MTFGGDGQGGVKMRYNCDMKTKPLTVLLSLAFLFLFSGSVFGDDQQDSYDAYKRKDYKKAYKLIFPFYSCINQGGFYQLMS